jgi:hypothetical protein
MADEPKIWARKGEQVVCIKGHPICAIAHDIHVGDPRSGTNFTDWVQPEPDKATSVAEIRCAICRSVWIRGSRPSGYQFHFADGWR